MSEFDFDELDRAVNSVMNSRNQTNQTNSDDTPQVSIPERPQTDDSERQTPNIEERQTAVVEERPETEPVTTEPPESASSSDSDKPAEPEPSYPDNTSTNNDTSRPSVVPKRRGKFMDMVRTPNSVAATENISRAPSRQGVSLQPSNLDIKPATPIADITPVQATTSHETYGALDDLPAQETSVNTEPTTGSDTEQTSWPDPIDMDKQDTSESSTEEAASSNTVEQPNAIDDPIDFSDQMNETTDSVEQAEDKMTAPDPMSSPFLPDAKVEKRPLGGTPEPTEETESTDQSTDNSSEGLESNLPPELQASVLSVEGQQITEDVIEAAESAQGAEVIVEPQLTGVAPDDNTQPTLGETTDVDQPEVSTEEKTTEPAVEQKPDNEPLAIPTKPVPQPENPATNLVSSLPPRQAQPEASATDDDDDLPASSIFDSETNQPLKQPQKRSAGWYTVIIVGGMLLIGALGGVVFYLTKNGY